MKKSETKKTKPYKKMNSGKTRQSTGSLEIQRPKAAQILMIILLAVIILGLLSLIIMFLSPGKMRLWDLNSMKGDDVLVQRLLVPEDEPLTELTPEDFEEIPEAPKEEEPEKAGNSNVKEIRIYFVKVNSEGMISLKSVNRNVDFNSSPLTKSINLLIKGPDSDEINKGSLSLIPEGTRLLSARVEGGTAYLNFNEAFRFNPLGREGYLAQLKQIVYSTTEFSNIKDVQFLIEGVIREYLGGEGFYIGEPLSRDSFQNTL